MGKEVTVKQKLKKLVISSAVLVVLVLGIVSTILCSIAIKKDFRSLAETSTVHLKEALENGTADWAYNSEIDELTCNGKTVSVELFKDINDMDDTVFHTVFWDDTRVLTNIKNEKGDYAVGTQADATIYKKVKDGDVYTKNSVAIFGKKYTVSYIPIYSGGEFCGMLFTGIDQSAVTRTILSIVLCIAVGSVVVLVIMIFISNKILEEVSSELSTKLNSGYDELNDFAGDVRKISDRTNKEVSEISEAMDNVASGATSQAAATQEAMASTEEFTASIDVVNLEITESYDFIETIRGCVHESEDSIDELNTSIDSNNRIVDNISIDIENGVESTRKANSIVKTIDNLAFQINLLALNASVEASHAGSFGRGFAVVAEEIKNLAANSAESAKDTAEIIADIVETMNKTQSSNEKLVEANRIQMEKAAKVQEKMDILKENIKELVNKLDHIKENSDSLGVVKDELVQVIQTLSATSEENAAVSEQVSASTETVGADIDDLATNLSRISDICDDLKNIVNYFG